MFETAIRLLKDYRAGIVKQMVIIGKNDTRQNYRKTVKSPKEWTTQTDWEMAMDILRTVDAEIQLLENQ